jgi:hypothetical protein
MNYFLRTGEYPKGGKDFLDVLLASDEDVRAAWGLVRDGLLAEWVRAKPGTRPAAWWSYEAPELRRRVGGVGDDYSARGWNQTYRYGLPRFWIDPWLVSYFNGRSRDIHGEPIGTEYFEGNFPYTGYDASNPPTFESEAAYLRRRGLLSAAEAKRLSRADYEPEAITA